MDGGESGNVVGIVAAVDVEVFRSLWDMLPTDSSQDVLLGGLAWCVQRLSCAQKLSSGISAVVLVAASAQLEAVGRLPFSWASEPLILLLFLLLFLVSTLITTTLDFAYVVSHMLPQAAGKILQYKLYAISVNSCTGLLLEHYMQCVF